ncbi:MAG: TolB protein [Clostridiales bacterium]|nr:TolB protein [Clostridiales bacterium]
MIKFSRRTRNRRFWQTAVLSTAVAMAIIGLLTACQTDAYHRETVSEDGETLVMLTPIDETAAFDNRVERFDFQKIERYEGMRGEGWLDDDTILVTRPNEVIPPVVAFNAVQTVRSLYTFRLKDARLKQLSTPSAFIWAPTISPDRRYIFYAKVVDGVTMGEMSDVDGSVKVTVDEPMGYGQAEWLSNEAVIVPYGEDGVCIINADQTVDFVDGIGSMQTQRAVKVGDNIYYVGTDRTLKAYDLSRGIRSTIADSVLGFELSPNRDAFAVERRVDNETVSLVRMNLTGDENEVLAEGSAIFGIEWSPQQDKLAYIVISKDEQKTGLHILHLNKMTDLFVSREFVDVLDGVKWSPSGDKLLASIGEIEAMKAVDVSYVIYLK